MLQHAMQQFSGVRLLIVEDEVLVASDLARYFEDRGATILGPAPTIEAAQSHLDSANAAILDVNVNGKMVFPIADHLLAKSVPFVFFSGYDVEVIPWHLRHVRNVRKSGGRHVLLETLVAARSPVHRNDERPPALQDDDILAMLPELRFKARQYLLGKIAADRLVEQTLRVAITRVDQRPTDTDTFGWLCDLMAIVHNTKGPQFLD